MIAYLIFNSLLFIKLILFIILKIFLIPTLFSKYIIVLLFCFIIYLCYKYPKTHILIKEDFFLYALKTKTAHIYNIFILLLYGSLFIGGVFYLRYINKEKQVDLKKVFSLLKNFFMEYSWHEFSINCLIIILFIIIYLAIIYKFTLYFKFHVMKRHIYLIGDSDSYTWYYKFIQDYLWPINIYTNIPLDITNIISKWYEILYFSKQNKTKPLNFRDFSKEEQEIFHRKPPVSPGMLFEKYKLDFILKLILHRWHYILLLASIICDIKNNNFIITHFFYLLPWIFIYELYLRICQFADNIWPPYDEAFRRIVYSKELEIFLQEKTLLIDGEFYDLSFYQKMFKHYISRGFVKDSNEI